MEDSRWRAWAGLVARLALGGVWLWAGLVKISDPAESIRAVRAYRLLPESLVVPSGYGLPVLEVALALLLLAGLATRAAALVTVALVVAFMVAIGTAWARGLEIECGCFGGGGLATEGSNYVWDLVRDLVILLVAAYLAIWPRSRWAVDNLLRSRPPGAADTRARRAGLVGLAAVVALVVVTAAGVAVQTARLGGTDPDAGVPQGTTSQYGVPHGDTRAPVTVAIIEDFWCPFCRTLEDYLSESLRSYAESGEALVVYRPVALLDRLPVSDFSSRAANAAACVQDLGGVEAYLRMHDLLYGNQPDRSSTGLDDDELADLAERSGVSGSAAAGCIDDGTFTDWVAAATEAASRAGFTAVPTVLVDGTEVTFSEAEDPVETLRRAVEDAG
jgi:protein-disulfide isomerase